MIVIKTEIQVVRNGVPWAAGQFLHLPRHWTIGNMFIKQTPFGARDNHPMGFPPGPWLAAEDLQKKRFSSDFTVVGTHLPAATLQVIDAIGQQTTTVDTGFVLGALFEFPPFKAIYLVLYLGEDGRRHPRVLPPHRSASGD